MFIFKPAISYLQLAINKSLCITVVLKEKSLPIKFVILLILFANITKAQSSSAVQASVITANAGPQGSFPGAFGMAFEYQRKLKTIHLFGGFSFTSAINKTNNPGSGDEALDGYLNSFFSFDTGIEYILLDKQQNNLGFEIGPALRLRREVQPVLSLERQIFGESEILVQNKYRSKLDFGIVAFLDYAYILVSNIQLGLRAKYSNYGDQNGVFSAEIGVGYNF